MNLFLLGATAMGAVCIALFFVRFWRSTGDAFHLFFAASFLLLAAQRLLLAAVDDATEAFPASYLLRLAAYVLIIVAIVRKNVHTPPRAG